MYSGTLLKQRTIYGIIIFNKSSFAFVQEDQQEGEEIMQKVVYISNSRDFTEQNDINNNQYLVHLNKLLEDGWTISQMNTQTVEVDPKLENYLHKETLVSFVILEKPE